MKKIAKVIQFSVLLWLLAACSQETLQRGKYVKEAWDYASELHAFQRNLPYMLSDSLLDKEKREDTKHKFMEMRSDIKEFNSLLPPSELETVHQKVVEKNLLLDRQLENGLLLFDKGEKGGQKIKSIVNENATKDIIALLKELKTNQ